MNGRWGFGLTFLLARMKEIGELSELRFLAEAYSRGFVVSKPFGDNAAYDFIIDFNGKLSRVQCKSTATLDERGRFIIYTVHGRMGDQVYSIASVDFLACYVFQFNAWYLIPINEVSTKTIRLYPHKTVKRAKFERFLEAWNLFEDKGA